MTSACVVPWSHIKIGYAQDPTCNISVICVNQRNKKNGFECTRFVNCLILVIFVYSVKLLMFYLLFAGQHKFKQGVCRVFLEVLDLLYQHLLIAMK